MVRDIRERLTLFGVGPVDMFEVKKVALTTAQVRQYNPPPNPAKMTDPRAEAYIRQHGRNSWEVDALDPPVLVRLITRAITDVIDNLALVTVKRREGIERGKIRTALEKVTL